MDVPARFLQPGRVYDAEDVYQQLHKAAGSPSTSTPLLLALFGAPTPVPRDRAYAGETPRMCAARQHVLSTLSRQVDRTLGELKDVQCRLAMSGVREALSRPGVQGGGALAPSAPAHMPCIVLQGVVNPVELRDLACVIEDRLCSDV